MIRIASLAGSLLLAGGAFAQLSSDWRTTYEDPLQADAFDRVVASAAAASGDVFWVSEHSRFNSTGGVDLWCKLHRSSAGGVPLWTVALSPANDMTIHKLMIDSAGDLVLVGRAGVYLAYPDVLAIKYGSDGTPRWQQQFGSQGNQYDTGFGFLDPSGQLSIVGNYDFGSIFAALYVRRYDAQGNVLSESTINAPGNNVDVLRAVAPLPGGDFVIGGENAGGAFIARLASTGSIVWNFSIPTPVPNSTTSVWSFDVDVQGRIAATGTRPNGCVFEGMLRVLDFNGNSLLDHSLGSAFGAIARRAAFASDGSLWCVGVRNLNAQGTQDVVVERFDPSLALVASRALDVGGASELVRQVTPGESGQAWLLASGAQLIEFDADAQTNWRQALATPNGGVWLYGFTLTSARKLVAFGQCDPTPPGPDIDAVLVQLDASDLPRGYCTAKVNALGCTPRLEFSGSPRAGAASGFTVAATSWRNQRSGAFVYGTGPEAALPFLGGTLCMSAPRARSIVLASGGNAMPADDCSGALSLDFSAFATGSLGGAPMPALAVAGTTVRAQAWGRDPGATFNAALSNALEFTVLP